MSLLLTTLFEGDYERGAAALLNSLHLSGFTGSFVCGYRGPLPAWSVAATHSLGFRVTFREEATTVHFTNYKPDFILRCAGDAPTETSAVGYIDPDIVVKAPAALIDLWCQEGVALVEDVNGYLPARHPYRLRWQALCRRRGSVAIRELDRYYNAGFIALPRSTFAVLEHWRTTLAWAAEELGRLDRIKNADPNAPFHTIDQDALNLALSLTDVPINGAGPEAMDFAPGGHLLSHAVGPAKPWRGGFLRRALHGYGPSAATKAFFTYANGPLTVMPPRRLRALRRELRLAAFIGRFYRRA